MEGEDPPPPAIAALGPNRFKLTEVYIWEDGSTEINEVPLFPVSLDEEEGGDLGSNNVTDLTSDFGLESEDAEFAKEMDALGLPMSFHSTKKTKKGKKKGSSVKPSHCVYEDGDLPSEVSEVETVSHTVLRDNTDIFLSCVSMLGQSWPDCYDVSVNASCCITADGFSSPNKVLNDDFIQKIDDEKCVDVSNNAKRRETKHCDLAFKGDNDQRLSFRYSGATPSTACHLTDTDAESNGKETKGNLKECAPSYQCYADAEEFCDGLERVVVCGIGASSQTPELQSGMDNQLYVADLGDWRVYFDSFYNRNYFYNIKTHTSTWDPPPGLEQQMLDHIMRNTDDSVAEVSAINDVASSTCGLLSDSKSCAKLSSGTGSIELSPEISLEFGNSTDDPDLSLTSSAVNCRLEHVDKSFDDDVIFSMPSDVQNTGSIIPEEFFEDGDLQIEAASSATQETDMKLELTLTKHKKKSRKLRACKKSYNDQKELQFQESEECSVNICKYWFQRYLLFSRFDEGIEMDEEGWFSVTPEAIAVHHALQCVDDVVIDCFTGVGGNSIQFAQRCRHVTAIDIDPKKIGYAYHNATIYGVEDQIDFVIGDFFSLAPTLKADTVFLSPPWGGPDYAKVRTYDLKTMLKPLDGYYLFKVAKQIARRVIMFLPKNIELNQLAELSLSCDPPWSVEVEKNYLNGKLKAITAYFSDTTLEGR